MKTIKPIAWTPLRPHAIQSQLWRCRQRFPTVAAGRGSGKTELALRKLALCGRVTRGRYFYAGPTIQQAKSVAWDRLVELIPPQWLAPNSPNRSELTIKTIYGCEIRVVGMDKPQRIEGVQYNGGVLDESADIKPGAFMRSLLPALSHHRGWCWRIGVPKRTGVGVREYKESFDKGIVDGSSFTWESADILPADIIDEARNQLDEVTFNEQFRATWESVAGGIYHSYDEKVNVRPCRYNSNKEIIVGSDFNVDPMCWVLGHMCYDTSENGPKRSKKFNRFIEIFDEIKLRNTNTPATLEYLHNKYRDHTKGWLFYGDAAGKNRSTTAALSDYQLIGNDDRFTPKRVRYPAANPQRKDRFAATNSVLKNAKGHTRVFIDPSCTNLTNDLSQRSYKEGTCEPDDAADIGHISDAFDYVIYAEFPIGWDSLLVSHPQVGLG